MMPTLVKDGEMEISHIPVGENGYNHNRKLFEIALKDECGHTQ